MKGRKGEGRGEGEGESGKGRKGKERKREEKEGERRSHLQSSPTGPAEHCAGGSLPRSWSS